jgi:hypothetical protein
MDTDPATQIDGIHPPALYPVHIPWMKHRFVFLGFPASLACSLVLTLLIGGIQVIINQVCKSVFRIPVDP